MKILTAACLCFASLIMYAAEINGFEISPSGAISKGGVSFAPGRHLKNWHYVGIRENNLQLDKAASRTGKDGIEIQGLWDAKEGVTYRFKQTILPEGENKIRCKISLETDTQVIDNGMLVDAHFPVKTLGTRPFAFNGKKPYIPTEFFTQGKKPNAMTCWTKGGELPVNGGTLKINLSDATVFMVQDNRVYKTDIFELRIRFKNSNAGQKYEMEFTMEFIPFAETPVALNSAANMGFADPVADDGKGGWTDQGPKNDLSAMTSRPIVSGNVRFSILDPETNGGKSCIVLKGAARPYFPVDAEIVLDKPVKAKYLYLLHAVAWEGKDDTPVGKVTVEADGLFVDKEIISKEILCGRNVSNFWNPRWIPEAEIAWTAKNKSAKIGLYATPISLAGGTVRKLRFTSYGKSVWMIVGATLSDCPPALEKEYPVVITANKDRIPVSTEPRLTKKGSAIDFSFLMDAPAGKYGFVKAVGDHFEFEKRPGEKVRFFGINYQNVPGTDRDDIRRSLDEYAATGYNLIRIHHFDNHMVDKETKNSLNMKADIFDRLDFFLAEAAKRGIYLTLDLFTSRGIFPNEIEGFPVPPSGNEYKALLFVNEAAMQNFEEYARRLMNHVNPYTGRAWKEEPSIVGISLVNEDTMYSMSINFSPRVHKLYMEKFNEWCKEKGRKITPFNKNAEWDRFLSESYITGWNRMKALCKEIGIRQPLTDQNFCNFYSVVLHRNMYDYADSHFYVWHPTAVGNGSPFRVPLRFISTSVIPETDGFFPLLPARLLNKPYWISEWDFCSANRFNVEGSFLVGAYSAAQDCTTLLRFCSRDGFGTQNHKRIPMIFFDGTNPMLNLGERAASLLFLRGDVAVSKARYPILINNEMQADEQKYYPRKSERLALLGKTGTVITEAPAAEFTDGAETVLDLRAGASGNGKTVTQADFIQKMNLDRDEFTNDTKELQLNRKTGSFKAVTPRSESFVTPAGSRLKGKFMEVQNGKTFSAYFIAAVDKQELASSKRLVLFHLTYCQNTDQRYRNQSLEIVESWGKLPTLAERGTGKVTLFRDLTGFKVYALKFSGERLCEIPFTVQDGTTRFALDTAVNGQAVGACEIVSE